ncbi:hypothetical protein [Mesorhizobium sp. IMUNJ 23232]
MMDPASIRAIVFDAAFVAVKLRPSLSIDVKEARQGLLPRLLRDDLF